MKVDINYKFFGDSFINNSDKSDLQLIESLIQHGFSKKDAEKYAVFTPIAFGRFYLNLKYRNLTFSNLYCTSDTNEKFPLLEDSIYKWATKLVEEDFRNSILSEDACLEITNRSSEIQGISQAFSEGKQLDGAKFRTVVFING